MFSLQKISIEYMRVKRETEGALCQLALFISVIQPPPYKKITPYLQIAKTQSIYSTSEFFKFVLW